VDGSLRNFLTCLEWNRHKPERFVSPVSCWRQRRTKLHRENLSQVCDPWHGRQRQGMSSYPIPLSEPPGRWCTLCTHTWPGPQASTCPRRIFVPSVRGPPPLQLPLPLPLPARLAAPDRQVQLDDARNMAAKNCSSMDLHLPGATNGELVSNHPKWRCWV